MSSKRSAAMGKINDFATTDQIKNAGSGDEAVNLFLHGPDSVQAPGTKPTKTTKKTSATVADQTEEDTNTVKGPSTVDRTVNEVVGAGQALATGTYNGLSNAPIPGGIGVPLVILLVLFIVLLPVNGHTRLMWLWLSLTGQAEIGGPLTPPTITPGGFGGGSGGSFASSSTGSPSVNPNQTGTTTTKPPSATKITSASKKTTTLKTNTSKTHGTSSHKGGGPGPMDPDMGDPTAPIHQLSYATLMASRNGYE